MPAISPCTRKLLWAGGVLAVIADVFFMEGFLLKILGTGVVAVVIVAIVLIILDDEHDFFDDIVKPAILGLLEKKTGVKLLKGDDVSKANKSHDWKKP